MVFFVQETYLNYSNYETILEPKTKMIKKYSIDILGNNGVYQLPAQKERIELTT
jgi:hypothetical protein